MGIPQMGFGDGIGPGKVLVPPSYVLMISRIFGHLLKIARRIDS